MITTINEWRKANEAADTANTTHFERIWDGMTFQQKEDLFGDEIGDLFDKEDNYDKELAVKFFNTKWNDIDDKYYNRLKYLMQYNIANGAIKINEYFVAPVKYKYNNPNEITYDILIDIIHDTYGLEDDDKIIHYTDFYDAAIKNINNMQLDNKHITKYLSLLKDNGWIILDSNNKQIT